MTDNAFAYLGHAFTALCELRGLRHLRTRPYTPRTNGKRSVSFKRCCVSGRTSARIDRPARGRRCCRGGCTTTIGIAVMPVSRVVRPSVACWPGTTSWDFTAGARRIPDAEPGRPAEPRRSGAQTRATKPAP